jgi:uncharacterized membrane-anchored protein YhcB (DUF1043 family)
MSQQKINKLYEFLEESEQIIDSLSKENRVIKQKLKECIQEKEDVQNRYDNLSQDNQKLVGIFMNSKTEMKKLNHDYQELLLENQKIQKNSEEQVAERLRESSNIVKLISEENLRLKEELNEKNAFINVMNEEHNDDVVFSNERMKIENERSLFDEIVMSSGDDVHVFLEKDEEVCNEEILIHQIKIKEQELYVNHLLRCLRYLERWGKCQRICNVLVLGYIIYTIVKDFSRNQI